MDCEFDIAEVLAQFNGQDCGNLAIADIDTIDVFLDCGDPGTDPLTLAVLLMLFFVMPSVPQWERMLFLFLLNARFGKQDQHEVMHTS